MPARWKTALIGAGVLVFVNLVLACGGALKPPVPVRHEMPIKAYRSTMPREPKTFAMDCELCSLYLGNRDRKALLAILCVEPETTTILYAYVRRDSLAGKQAFALLKDGKRHRLLATVHYPAGGTDADAVELDRIREPD